MLYRIPSQELCTDVVIAVNGVEPAVKYSYIYKGTQTRRKGQYKGQLTLSPLLHVKPLITTIRAILGTLPCRTLRNINVKWPNSALSKESETTAYFLSILISNLSLCPRVRFVMVLALHLVMFPHLGFPLKKKLEKTPKLVHSQNRQR